MVSSADWIDIIIRRAEDLRAAGITHLKVGDCEAAIGLGQPDFEFEVDEEPPPASGDPLDDPMTYGGRIPSPRGVRDKQ